MPYRKGQTQYKGFISPAVGPDASPALKKAISHTYSGCRRSNPGEDPRQKAKCARIAWSSAKKRGLY
ncbi:MAG: hypothetical protein MUO73_05640 [Thermoplasmata archaeon]|nr:hypothetical protein [Thermoplasmata archaeon]